MNSALFPSVQPSFCFGWSILCLSPRIIRAEPATYLLARPRVLRSTSPPLLLIAKVTVTERVIKDTRWDWLVATTNVEFVRTLTTKVFERAYIGNKRLADSIFESARRLLSWSGQQKTNILASLKAGVH